MKLRTWWTLPAGLVLVLAVMAIALVNAPPAAAQTQGSAAGFASTPTPTRTRTPTPTPTFTPAPPPAPALLAPPDSGRTTGHDSGPLGMPTFQWVMPSFAAIAHIQISNTPGFATVLVDVDTRAGTYTPTAVWLDGVYYWRVKAGVAVSGGTLWGPYSESYSFTKNWSDSDTIKPDLLLPEANAQRSSFGAGDFSWTAIPGAAGYTFEIAADAQFSSVVYTADTLLPQHTPTERLASNVYYWRVTPFAYYGGSTPRVAGTPSDPRSFTINWSTPPQLIAPAHLYVTAFLPRFQWQAVEGASKYELQVSSDFNFGGSKCQEPTCTIYTTSSTDYTPANAGKNDQDLYWRVRAADAKSNPTAWSEVRQFSLRWNIQPKLLTPRNNETMLSYPFFSWEPVPGAERYQIQIDESDEFAAPLVGDVTIYNGTSYTHPTWQYVPLGSQFHWRVRALNAEGAYTPWAEPWSFSSSYNSVAPNLIYPPFTYDPDAAALPVHRTTSVAWPVFVWDTAHKWNGTITYGPDRYWLEVDDDPGFGTPNLSIQTRTLAAAPVWGSGPTDPMRFKDLVDGTLYYWRVRAFAGATQFGETKFWQMRYSRSASEVAPSTVMAPMTPRPGFEAVGAPPVLGWQPAVINGIEASSYHVQVSRTADFSAVIDEAHAQFIFYVPWQGRDTELAPGTYWWRVRPESSPGAPLADWSSPRSFNLSFDVVMGNPTDLPLQAYPKSIVAPGTLPIASLSQVAAITATSGDRYQLTTLHALMDRSYIIPPDHVASLNWVIAFKINPTGQPVRYGIYIDRNHFAPGKSCAEALAAGEQDAGAPADPAGQGVSFTPIFAPEYVIYIDWDGAAITAVNYYRWNGVTWDAKCQWDPVKSLGQIGGLSWYDADNQAIQLLVPPTAFTGVDDVTGSLAMALFSTTNTPGDGIHQSVPAQGTLPGSTPNTIDSPVFVSDMLMPLAPFDMPFNNPMVYQDMPAVRWRMPVFDSVDGYRVQVALDARFTQSPITWETYETNKESFFAMLPASFQSSVAHADNESYYWRVQIRHEKYDIVGHFDYGPWSPPMRFKLDSRRVGNPRLSTGPNAFMTPTFEWDRVEGAAGYVLQVDDDAKFGSPLIDVQVDGTSYTPPENSAYASLKSLTTYYWRVAMRRSNSVFGQWSDPMPFVKTSVAPTPLSPLTTNPTTVIAQQPTFTWAVVLTPTDTPRLATAQYRLQVDDDPSFGSPRVDTVTTATSFTVPRGKSLADGTWYWRVAIMEASGQSGPFSTPQMFVKQYPLPGMVAPTSGSIAGEIPAFVWQVVPGAAYYKFSVANNDAFTGATTTNTMQRTYTPTAALKNGQYYWRIQMYDLDDVAGPIVAGRFNLGYSLYLPSLSKSK